MTGRVLLAYVVILCALAVLSVPARAQQFELGDVILSGDVQTGGPQDFDYKLVCYHANGQLKTVLSDGPFFDFGMLAFSPHGVLYATSARGIETVSASGTIAHGPRYGVDAYKSIAFTADGTLLASGDPHSIIKFSPSGTLVNTYALTDLPEGSSLDVAADQCTVYWLDVNFSGFDFCSGNQVQGPPFPDGGDFRFLRDGGVAISQPFSVEIYSANGTLVRTISAHGGALALDPDGTSIWLAGGGVLSRFDMATGNILVGPIQTGLPGTLGLTVYGEPRAAFVNGALAAIPVFSQSILLVLCAALAALALVRLRV
jgi:hypothetical protein